MFKGLSLNTEHGLSSFAKNGKSIEKDDFMANIKPTEAQISFLKNRGIVFPPTKGACNLLISYIKQGNGTVGDNESARIALTISYQKKWIGKTVRALASFAKGDDGVVTYLGARDIQSIQILRDAQEGDKYHPFWRTWNFLTTRSRS